MEECKVQVFNDRTEWRNQDGKLHRKDGPAVEWTNGSKSWLKDGKPHRLDGPAVEYSNGHKSWWVDGKLHRLDGPAVEYPDISKEFNILKDNFIKRSENQPFWILSFLNLKIFLIKDTWLPRNI